ncbi:MAG TPA: formate dehydrogenase accessory sulfurtransferase FdhD [Phycicoccus sp.]|nr:formate dehydrogenase accessory sulfurtransferase FdhD [Phycicoccus sp.]HQK30326.1 formate dehydrogenase accessory sulfurtransferase FdhD [Phycicoccus sp.]
MGSVTTRVPRTRFDADSGTRTPRPDTVVVEEPLEIRLGDSSVATTMRTPGDDFDLALGHLLTEGLISQADDVAGMMHCTDVDESGSPTYNVVDVALRAGILPRRPVRERAETMTSACGVCGSRTIEDVTTQSPYAVADDPLSVSPAVVVTLPAALREHQGAFDRTGGAHAAALTGPDGIPRLVREDIGRHNAVDKVIGAAAREALLPFRESVLVVSARASFEIVQKALVAGIPAVVAVGAPSSLAVQLATTAGLTLVAFTRPPTFSVYSRPDRIA